MAAALTRLGIEEIGLEREASGRTSTFHVRTPAVPAELADARTQTHVQAHTQMRTHVSTQAGADALAGIRGPRGAWRKSGARPPTA